MGKARYGAVAIVDQLMALVDQLMALVDQLEALIATARDTGRKFVNALVARLTGLQ